MTLVNADTGEIVPVLEDLEKVIQKGLTSFVQVGDALMRIRDERLYRVEYDTFETYCWKRWQIRSSRARQLIGAVQTVTAVTVAGGEAPTTERQARALTPLKAEPEKMAEAMRVASEATSGKPTAKAIEKAVANLVESAEAKAQDAAELNALMDELNPPDFDKVANLEAVRQRGEFARLCRDIRSLPSPADFLATQGADLRERHHTYAREAHAWLTSFLSIVEEAS